VRNRIGKLQRELKKLEKLVVKQQRLLTKHKSQVCNLQNELQVAKEGKDLCKAENDILRRNMAFLKRNMRQLVAVRAEQVRSNVRSLQSTELIFLLRIHCADDDWRGRCCCPDDLRKVGKLPKC